MYNTTSPHLFWKIFVNFLTTTLFRTEYDALVRRRFSSNFVAFSENPNFKGYESIYFLNFQFGFKVRLGFKVFMKLYLNCTYLYGFTWFISFLMISLVNNNDCKYLLETLAAKGILVLICSILSIIQMILSGWLDHTKTNKQWLKKNRWYLKKVTKYQL